MIVRIVKTRSAIVLYSAALAVLAGALFVTALHDEAPLAEPHLPWWAIAVGVGGR